MNRLTVSRVSTDPPPGDSPNMNSLAQATAALHAHRPIQSARLQQIALRLQTGERERAGKELSDYLTKYPDDPDALSLMAQAACLRDHRRQALPLLARCLELAPDFALARFNYANLLVGFSEYEAALNEVDILLVADGRNPLFRQLKATILETLGDGEQSLAIYEELLTENPERADCWVNYGHGLRALGHQDKSVAAYRKAIERHSSLGQAYWSLANMKTVCFTDGEIRSMQQQLKRTDISPGDRVPMQFALGKAYEDLREYGRAFEQYARANAAMRPNFNYDPDLLSSAVAENKALFTADFFDARRGTGNKAPDPIFILGRPRSGSTLVEQILSSHSAIEGTAELPYIIALAERLGERESGPVFSTEYLRRLVKLDPAALAELGTEYLAKARLHRKLGRPFFIDKKPANFTHIGMIHLILPNAKIIDARRNPAACGFSTFKMYSSKSRLRLNEIGRFYRDYVELMAHFDAVLPGRIHRVIYEELVADPEKEVRRLLEYLGLPFEEACLRFYETKRTVLTPSSEQVRRPISGEAVDYWRNFEPWLRPLIGSLGSVFTAYPSVPAELA